MTMLADAREEHALMLHFEGLSDTELADRLGCKPERAYALRRAGARRLARAMSGVVITLNDVPFIEACGSLSLASAVPGRDPNIHEYAPRGEPISHWMDAYKEPRS